MAKRSERRTNRNKSTEQGATPGPVATGHRPGEVPELLTLQEIDKLIVLTAAGFDPQPVTDDVLEKVMAWARKARAGESLLNLLLMGHIVPVGFKDGEPGFRTTAGTLSPQSTESLLATLQRIDEGGPHESELSAESQGR